ncbi:alcohol dehydrogenase catalytic domain-containing protein [Streptosporangium sp. NBC_01755]|uniref:zinc-binding dehydrogenase n=1 Tax=unclassified Streptosporangium TaxID=2632669 RepID=UPI002DDA45E3|nr:MULTISPECIES: alcohol dehydrogenase catalytic domain-containing protein [unclassified Streptosporangium]WSA27852.1 alcohol dehydrogenase catalytic domain-containing protein [Streptosporangium sp. NBC_01810]WSD00676.1 alcohol dehydrogenase catalytic domain-containing protein [Streptosporangium sp. NBC_01755]
MRAVVFDEFGADLEVREVPAPEPPPGGAVIRVEATGLCRSDWHGWQGHDPDIQVPHVPGHELAGVVEAVGAGVASWRPGDRVTVPFVCACGSCAACAAGEQQVCERQTQPGFTHWGSFAEYVAIDHADVNLVRLPEEMSFGTAASLGCRFATAYRAVASVGRARPGEWVAVHGCGGVGLSAVMIAAAAGARVIAVDISTGALEMARAFGATACVSAAPAEADVPARVMELTSGGAHVSIDALGSPETCAASIESLRRRGRHVQVGLLPGLTALPMDRVIGYELELLGSHGMAARAYPAMLEAVTDGTLRPDALITRSIGLQEAGAALASIGSVPGVTMIIPSLR